MNTMIVRGLLVGSLALGAQVGFGQDSDPILSKPMNTTPASSPKGKVSGTLGGVFAQIEEQEAIRRAGLKANVLRQIQTVLPMVVVVHDAPSYLHAIANWEGGLRFPILWDDGSVEAREHIARFVRGFDPKKVIALRYKDSDDPDGWASKWNADRANREKMFSYALSSAMDSKAMDWNKSLADLNAQGVVSPGIVVCDVTDKTWAAALALSAGRLQPIVFAQKPSGVYQPMSLEDSDALERVIERAAQTSGHAWKEIGDDIDAITLAMNTGTRIKTGSGDRQILATTDRIGRLESGGTGARWAYCGQLIGNEARTVYQAMCALFLEFDQGFVWDGYESGGAWGLYDGTEAGEVLEKMKLKTEVHDLPKNSLRNWKLRMVRPIGERRDDEGNETTSSAGIMLMNSKGASNYFDLLGTVDGTGKPGHLPILGVPMALHVVHSFSLQHPMNRTTVGGRFLERGMFVYAGSVDEPYLNAFVPTPTIAKRLGGTLAFAAAVRYDESKVWKVTVLGDPLMTIGPAGNRLESAITIPGGVELGQRYRDRLGTGEFAGAIADLAMIGRDDSAARIAKALLKDRVEAFDSKVALAAIPVFFRTGDYVEILDAYERLDADGQVDGLMQDVLWLISPYLMARYAGDDVELSRVHALLRANLRTGQKLIDAETLAMSMRSRSMADAVSVMESLRPMLNTHQAKMLDRAIGRVRK